MRIRLLPPPRAYLSPSGCSYQAANPQRRPGRVSERMNSPELSPLRFGCTKEDSYRVACPASTAPRLTTKHHRARDYTVMVCRSRLFVTLLGPPLSAGKQSELAVYRASKCGTEGQRGSQPLLFPGYWPCSRPCRNCQCGSAVGRERRPTSLGCITCVRTLGSHCACHVRPPFT